MKPSKPCQPLPSEPDIADIASSLNAMDQGLAVYDGDLHLVICNRRYLDLLDFPAALGKPGTPLIDCIEFNARKGAYGAGDIGKIVKNRMRRIKSMANQVFERQTPRGKTIEVRHNRLDNGGLISTYTDVSAHDRAAHDLDLANRMIAVSPDLFSIIGPDYGYQFVNPAYEKMFGMPVAAIIGKKVADLLGEEDFSTIAKPHIDAAFGGQETNHQVWFDLGGTRKRYLRISAYPLPGLTGDIESVMIIGRDLTDIKSSEEAAHGNEVQMANAQRLAHVGSWHREADGDSVWSDEMYRIYGVDRAQFTPTLENWQRMVHPDDQPGIRALLARVEAEKLSRTPMNYRIVRPGGEERFLESDVEFLRDDRGNITSVSGVLRDITEKWLADRALQDSETRLRGILDSTADGIIAVDRKGLIETFNRAAEYIFGWTAEEMRGKPISRLLPDHHIGLKAACEAGEAPVSVQHLVELSGFCKGGREISVVLSVSGMEIGGNTVFVCSVRDITEFKEQQAQLRQAQKMEAVGQLTGGIAHDFNNLLAVVIGNSELLDEALADSAVNRKLVDAIHRSATRGAELTRRLLAFSRQQPLENRVTSINDLVNDMNDILARTLGEAIVYHVDLAADVWFVQADPNQLENALLNLTLNATDAMKTGGELTISTRNVTLDDEDFCGRLDLLPGQYVALRVADNGCGMNEDVLEHVLEPFFTTKGVGEGSGLGLPMIYGFTKQLGGSVQVESEAGKGTQVTLYIPRCDSVPEKPAVKDHSGPVAHGRDELVLVVEDDPDVRMLSVGMLESLGYRTVEAATAEQALEVLNSNPDVAVVFSDIVLPGGVSGVDLAKTVASTRANIEVIFTSGYHEDHLSEADAGLSRVGLLGKPFRRAELADRMKQVLNNRPASQQG